MFDNILELSKDVIEPEVIREMYPDITEEQYNFLQAIITIHNNNDTFENFYLFESIINALNFKIPDFSNLSPPNSEELWHGIKLMKKIGPSQKFSDEVKIYSKTLFNEDGIYFYPPELDIKDDNYLKVKKKSEDGPFPLGSDILSLQASKYLVLNDYHENKINENLTWIK